MWGPQEGPLLEDARLPQPCCLLWAFSSRPGHVCFSLDYWKKMAKVLRSAGHYLIPVKENLVDKIWTDRPERPCKPLLTLALDYTGQNCSRAQQYLQPSSPPPVAIVSI